MRDTQTYFWYGNAAARTFGRAHRHRPYVFCLRELRVDVCPYGFVWVDYTRTVDFVWADYAQTVGFVWQIACGWLVALGWITRGYMRSFARHFPWAASGAIRFFCLSLRGSKR